MPSWLVPARSPKPMVRVHRQFNGSTSYPPRQHARRMVIHSGKERECLTCRLELHLDVRNVGAWRDQQLPARSDQGLREIASGLGRAVTGISIGASGDFFNQAGRRQLPQAILNVGNVVAV